MRKEFEMSEDQLEELLNACKPTPVMYISGGAPMFKTPQENANYAWKKLGKELHFEYMTVQSTSKGQRFFTAETKEETQNEPS